MKSGLGWIEVGPWDSRLSLVVNGAEENCELFTKILASRGFTVVVATKGEVGVEGT